jgi:hypothetical protein
VWSTEACINHCSLVPLLWLRLRLLDHSNFLLRDVCNLRSFGEQRDLWWGRQCQCGLVLVLASSVVSQPLPFNRTDLLHRMASYFINLSLLRLTDRISMRELAQLGHSTVQSIHGSNRLLLLVSNRADVIFGSETRLVTLVQRSKGHQMFEDQKEAGRWCCVSHHQN